MMTIGNWRKTAAAFLLLFGTLSFAASAAEQFVRPNGAPTDVLPEDDNLAVTAVSENCETVRMALGAAWDDAQAARSFAWYLGPWVGEAYVPEARRMIERGAYFFELMNSVDGGIQSVRLARDSRSDAETLLQDVQFWRNELALAAGQVVRYAEDAAALRKKLAGLLKIQAEAHGISAQTIQQIPWDDPDRESWRAAGAKTGIRIPIQPDPDGFTQWWLKNLSFSPGYMITKYHQAGEAFFTGEVPIGAWGFNALAPGKRNFTQFNQYVQALALRQSKLMLELPTLQETLTPEEIEAQKQNNLQHSAWIWDRYAAPLPKSLENDLAATLVALTDDGKPQVWGGVQLFNPEISAAYGDYLKAMASNLREQGLYDTVAAIHLEKGASANLPEAVDFSPYTRERWQKFMRARYTTIEELNRAAGTEYASFDQLPIPRKQVDARAAADWAEFLKGDYNHSDVRAWGRYLQRKYGRDESGIRAAIGDDYREGYGWRFPLDYRPIIKTDYLAFRRQWVEDYMAIKKQLIQAAFPGKLVIYEPWQFGDHSMIAQRSEEKWGGFLRNDMAQFTNVGLHNDEKPFMIRSVGPVGFGSRPSDSIESLFKGYLWINFRDPANLTRYFYDWVAHGYLDHQLGWQGITNHWLTNRLIYKLGPTVANTMPKPQRIGLLLPRTTFDLFNGPIYYSYMGWDWTLHAAKLPYTRVDEEVIRNGELGKLKLDVLILPDVRAMDKELADEITTWVAFGGTLIASPLPGNLDEYGRKLDKPWLADVLGVQSGGTVSEAVKDTPLTITIPRGHFSGRWATETDRKPDFQVLTGEGVQTLASYESGEPAITLTSYGKGRAIAIGYPFGTEAVTCEQTSIGFQRTYVLFCREPQLVARVDWLRKFIVDQLGYNPDYGVDFAEVGRWGPELRESWNPSLSLPKNFDQERDEYFFSTTVGDPRGDMHEMEVKHETPDIAIRFFPRRRDGVDTEYLGISTRDVHYMTGRANVNMYLSQHRYRCRINNPAIQSIWDVGRDVPVGFARDDRGVSFDVELASGYIMMLAISEKPQVELFGQDGFPGRSKAEVVARAREISGGQAPPDVAILTPDQLNGWFEQFTKPVEEGAEVNERNHPYGTRTVGQKEKVLISYGEPANRRAAEKLASYLRNKLEIDADIIQQAGHITDFEGPGSRFKVADFVKPQIFIGNEWTNNDMALHMAMWPWGYGGIERNYGAHMPFTASYNWPGPGRAVVSLSRAYALIDENGRQISWRFNHNYRLRPVIPDYPLLRRKLYIAATGTAAEQAVDAVIRIIGQGRE